MIDVQAVCRQIESATSVAVAPDDALRAKIPNSLMIMQAIMEIENAFGVSVDLAGLDYEVTPADLARALSEPREAADLQPEMLAVPLNSIQTAYLLGSEEDLELGGQATFMYVESTFDCTPSRLEEAVTAMVARHEILDCAVDLESGSLVPGGSGVEVSVIEGTLGDPAACIRIREQLLEQARRSNDSGSMVSLVISDADGGCRLHAYFNMIVFDAGSMYVFFRELKAMLAGESLEDALPLADAYRTSFGSIDEQARERDLAYWRAKAAGFPDPVSFPVKIMGDADWKTVRISHILDAELVRGLEERAEQAQASLSALLLACCSSVVARWLDVDGLTCNVTVSRRSYLGQRQSTIGDFTSSMLVGSRIGAHDDILALAKTLSDDMFEGLVHNNVSGVEVMVDALRSQDDQQSATAPIVFTSYLGGDQSFSAGVDYVYTQTAQVCLDMQAMPAPGGRVSLSWDLVPQYFPQHRDMFARLMELLEEVSTGLTALPLHDFQTESALRSYNDTQVDLPSLTMLDLVRASVLRLPDAVAIGGVRPFTYRQLWEASGRLAGALQERGCKPDDAVVVEFEKKPADVVAMVAAHRVGAAYVPVAATQPESRKQAIRELLGSPLVITTAEAEELSRTHAPLDEEHAPGVDDLAYVIFTSGSTGVPKGVEITHRGAVNTIVDINRRYGVDERSRLIALSSFGFDLSVFDIFGAFAAGASVTIVSDERDADEIIAILEREGITHWNSAPAILELLLLRCEGEKEFPTLHQVLLSGDRIPASMPRRAREVFPAARINSLGGATEASIWSICCPLQDDSLETRIPYGYPLANQQMHVLGHDFVPCPRGVMGQIWIGGAGVARGYAGAPEQTAAAFVEIPGLGRCYRTGDLGVFNHEGFIEFIGRNDRQVKVAGYRIELGEVEAAFTRTGLVQTAVCFTSPGRPGLVCAYVAKGALAASDARKALAAQLPGYMVPQTLLALDAIPMTANGKVDYAAIVARAEQEGAGLPIDVAVRAEASEGALGIVRSAFSTAVARELDGRGAEDDASFFALGGNSIGFQVMLREVEKASGIRLRFRDVIRDPSVAAVASLLDAAGADGRPDAGCVSREGDLDSASDAEAEGMYEPFALTDMQMAYYIGRHDGFDLGGVGEHYYVESVAEVDLERLEEALNAVIARHEMLRVVFTDDGRQRLLPQVPRYRIPVTDASDCAPDQIERLVEEKREALSHERFDLEQWPLFRFEAIALPDAAYRLFFSVDMIIGDGASQRIFIRDLTQAYEGARLEPLTRSYRTYVEAMARQQKAREAEPYGPRAQAIIERFPAGNVLPHKAASPDTVRMARLSWTVEPSVRALLEARSRDAGVSLSATLLAAYAQSLAVFARDGRVGINVTTYNRDFALEGIEDMFGDFTGVALVDYDECDEEKSLVLMQEALLEALEEGRSGVRLINEIGRRAGIAGQAIAPFVFTSLLFGDAGSGAGVFGRVDYAISQTPQVLIDNQIMQAQGALSVSWDYVEQVFERAVMEAMFECFKAALLRFAEGDALYVDSDRALMRLVRTAWANTAVEAKDEQAAKPVGSASAVSAASAEGVVEQISALAREASGKEILSVQASLFDQGVDSLTFVKVVQAVQKTLGVNIPLAQALAEPTLCALARLASERMDGESRRGDAGGGQAASSLTLLRDGDPERVVLCLHGGFGTVDIYRDLAVGMPHGVQVWALGFDAWAEKHPQVLGAERICATYRSEVGRMLPDDASIVVAGWSVGGTLAHEMARQLGERCAGLVLLDSLAPGYRVDTGSFSLESDAQALRKAGVAFADADSLESLWESVADDAAHVRKIAKAFSQALYEDLGVSAGSVGIEQFSTLRTLIGMRNAYDPAPVDVATLFVAPDDGEAFNRTLWSGLVGPLETEAVTGNHYSFIAGPESGACVGAVARFVADRFSEKEGDVR